MRMGHKVVAYHLNCNIDSPQPHTMWAFFFCKADDKLKSNSLFVIHSFNDSYAKCIFMQLDITKHWTLSVYRFSTLSMILWFYHHNTKAKWHIQNAVPCIISILLFLLIPISQVELSPLEYIRQYLLQDWKKFCIWLLYCY